ncbi:M20/M25/M40 family metallo-hydrolase [Kordiimonas aquimaris]|uniref:M20/M25/M40 family metallo-hydrolase n=1 Tax=Kordiimonas aquimaris TaxID=707591 RepID=UPI0021D28EAD|nr:M20/M25/M40 family metallo-hydrolase [Kordiimonas aquimaris]
MRGIKSHGLNTMLVLVASWMLASCSAEENTQEQTEQSALKTAPRQAEPSAIVLSDAYKTEIASLAGRAVVANAFEDIVQQDAQNIKDLIELTEIPAPPFEEQVRARRFAEMLRAAGLVDVSIDDVGNVIGRRPGSEGARVVAIAAHLDTVFPADTDVTVRIEGNTYHAPGIGDNTRGLVMMLSLLRTMQTLNLTTHDDILFVGSVGEEGLGDLRGVKHLFRAGGPQIDAFIAIDGGSANRLIYGGVGSHRYRVTVNGPGGHSWGAFGLANPHQALGRIINNFVTNAPDVTNFGPKTSYSIGRIGGGTSINSIPFSSWMEVDMRSGNQEKLDDIDVVFQQAIQAGLMEENTARKSGPELTVEIKQVGKRPAGMGNPNAALVQRTMAAMNALGIEARPAISSTDSNIPISLGIPAVTISRGGRAERAHSPDERWHNEDSHVAIQIGLLTLLSEAGFPITCNDCEPKAPE